MTLEHIKIQYSENSSGRHTDSAYTDPEGHPLAARMAGWKNAETVLTFLTNCRKFDRNRIQ